MKRDDDYIRELLKEIEASDDPIIQGYTEDDELSGPDKRLYHFQLLEDAGLVRRAQPAYYYRMTNAGHDFLAAIADPGLWERTKKVAAETGGNVTLDVLKTLAIGLLRTEISKRTGIQL